MENCKLHLIGYIFGWVSAQIDKMKQILYKWKQKQALYRGIKTIMDLTPPPTVGQHIAPISSLGTTP